MTHVPAGHAAWLQSQRALDCRAWLASTGGLNPQAQASVLGRLATGHACGGHSSATPSTVPLGPPAVPPPDLLPLVLNLALEHAVSPALVWDAACASHVWPQALPPLSSLLPTPPTLQPVVIPKPPSLPSAPPAPPPQVPVASHRPSQGDMPTLSGPQPLTATVPVTRERPSPLSPPPGPVLDPSTPAVEPPPPPTLRGGPRPSPNVADGPTPSGPPATAASPRRSPRKWGSLAALAAHAPSLPSGRAAAPLRRPRVAPLRASPAHPGAHSQPTSPVAAAPPLALRIRTILGPDCGPAWAPFLAKMAMAPPPDCPPLPAAAAGDRALAAWVADLLQLLPHVPHMQPCLPSLGPAPALFKSAASGRSPVGHSSLADLVSASSAKPRRGKRGHSASPTSSSSPAASGATSPAREQRPLHSPRRRSSRLRNRAPTFLAQIRPDPAVGGPAAP